MAVASAYGDSLGQNEWVTLTFILFDSKIGPSVFWIVQCVGRLWNLLEMVTLEGSYQNNNANDVSENITELDVSKNQNDQGISTIDQITLSLSGRDECTSSFFGILVFDRLRPLSDYYRRRRFELSKRANASLQWCLSRCCSSTCLVVNLWECPSVALLRSRLIMLILP